MYDKCCSTTNTLRRFNVYLSFHTIITVYAQHMATKSTIDFPFHSVYLTSSKLVRRQGRMDDMKLALRLPHRRQLRKSFLL